MPKNPGIPVGKAPPTVDQVMNLMQKDTDRQEKEKLERGNPLTGEPKKAPKPLRAPNAKKWLERVERSRKVQKDFREDRARFLRMYQGDYSEGQNRSGKSGGKRGAQAARSMSVNILYSHIEIITPAVFSGFPYVKARPKPKTDVKPADANAAAYNMELTINHFFKEMAADDELHDVFFDNFFGDAGAEIGWETQIEERGEEIEDEDEGISSDVGDNEDGEDPELPPVIIKKDGPFLVRREPDNIILDPDAPRRKESRWVAIRDVMLYNDFLASPTFNDRAKQEVKPQVYPIDMAQDADNPKSDRENRSEKEWVLVYYCWDKDTRKKYTVAPRCDFFLEGDETEGLEWPYDINYKGDQFPVCIKAAKRDAASPYSWSEFKAYESQIVELNRIRNSIQIHVKRSLPRYFHTQQLGTRDKVNKLMNSRSDESTEVESMQALGIVPIADMPKDLWQFNEMAKDDLLNVSGLFEYQGDSIADTATEASLIEGRSQVRKSIRSKEWEQYVVEIASKLAQLCQQNLDQAIAIEIAGQNGVEWLTIDKNNIQGEFHFEIEPGNMEYKNESLRKQQLLKFMEIAGQDPNVNRRNLIQMVAKEMEIPSDDIILPENELPQGPPPPPTVDFKDIDVLAIVQANPQLGNAIILAACQQNNVQIPPEVIAAATGAPPPPGAGPAGPGAGAANPPPPTPPGPAPSGKDFADAGMNPNGNPALPPVQGNMAEISGGSTVV